MDGFVETKATTRSVCVWRAFIMIRIGSRAYSENEVERYVDFIWISLGSYLVYHYEFVAHFITAVFMARMCLAFEIILSNILQAILQSSATIPIFREKNLMNDMPKTMPIILHEYKVAFNRSNKCHSAQNSVWAKQLPCQVLHLLCRSLVWSNEQ